MARSRNLQTDEDKILGNSIVTEEIKNIHYEDKNRMYKITNLQLKNEPTIVNGTLVESFIGSKNIEARKDLKNGALKVLTKDIFGNEMYKIEVIE